MRRFTHTFPQRISAFLLCLALLVGLLPLSALAANEATVYVGSVALTGSKETPAYATTDADGNVTTKDATAENYNIKWDGSTLTLRNATIQQAEEYSEKNNEKIAVYRASGDLNLVLVGENTVDAQGNGSAASCGINLGSGSLTIRGEGNASLSVLAGPTTNGNSCGIYANGAITMESGTVTVTGESASGDSYGIYPAQSFTVKGGNITAQSGKAGGSSFGIRASGAVTIEGGSVNATSGEAQGDSCGIFAEASNYKYNNSVTINGGTVTATAGNAVGNGWYSCGIRSEGPITITSGTVNATGKTSNYRSSCGIYAVRSLEISGGTVTATGGTAGSGESSGIYAVTLPQFGELKVLIQDATVTATGMACTSGISSGIFAESEGSEGVDVQVAIEDSIVTATGGTAGTGSYGILADDDASTVTINGNSVVRANMTGTVGDDGKPISGTTVEKESGIIFENGEGTVHGNVTLREDLTIGANESLDIPNGASLTIPEDTTLTNNGAITNEGALTNNGTLTIGQSGSLTGNVSGNVLYAVTVVTSGSGSASASKAVAETGDTVTLTASPGSGYHFERWEVVSGGVTLTGNQFTMPACPVTVKAVFEKNPYIPPTYAVTVPDTTGGTVEVSPSRASSGRRVTITTQPAPGYELESLTVLDSRGSEIALTDQGDGKYTFTMPSRKVTVQASFAPVPLPFEDVPPGAWYESAVRYVYTHGIMEGMSATTFVPGKSLTRAEAVQVLYNLEGQPTVSGNAAFPDLVEKWYKPAIAWAEQTGVVDGYEDGTFRPGQPVNRMEFAQMLYNYAKYKGYNLTAQGDLTAFPDGDSVQPWAETAMTWANGNQLINGHDDGTLEPGGTTTRAQAASILMRFDQKLVEE